MLPEHSFQDSCKLYREMLTLQQKFFWNFTDLDVFGQKFKIKTGDADVEYDSNEHCFSKICSKGDYHRSDDNEIILELPAIDTDLLKIFFERWLLKPLDYHCLVPRMNPWTLNDVYNLLHIFQVNYQLSVYTLFGIFSTMTEAELIEQLTADTTEYPTGLILAFFDGLPDDKISFANDKSTICMWPQQHTFWLTELITRRCKNQRNARLTEKPLGFPLNLNDFETMCKGRGWITLDSILQAYVPHPSSGKGKKRKAAQGEDSKTKYQRLALDIFDDFSESEDNESSEESPESSDAGESESE